jgi:hypothetical protein
MGAAPAFEDNRSHLIEEEEYEELNQCLRIRAEAPED